MSREALFGCSALALDLPCRLMFTKETMTFMFNSIALYDPSSLKVPSRHCKDLIPPWSTHIELFQQCQDIVALLNSTKEPSISSSPLFAQPIHWHLMAKNITLVKLFVGISIGLVVALEAKLQVKWYIHVDNEVTPN